MDEPQGHLPEDLFSSITDNLKSHRIYCCVEGTAYLTKGEIYLMEQMSPQPADSYMFLSFYGNISQ